MQQRSSIKLESNTRDQYENKNDFDASSSLCIVYVAINKFRCSKYAEHIDMLTVQQDIITQATAETEAIINKAMNAMNYARRKVIRGIILLHDDLVCFDGVYAKLWRVQMGERI